MILLKTLLTIIFLSLISIAVCVIFLLTYHLCVFIPYDIHQYKHSLYFSDIHTPYKIAHRSGLANYRFYNSAKYRGLLFKYIKQKSNKLEYFIYNDTIFLFPNFDKIVFNEQKGCFEVLCKNKHFDYNQKIQDLVLMLDNNDKNFSVKILVERAAFGMDTLKDEQIPKEIYLVSTYEQAFENDSLASKIIIPRSSIDVYNMMLSIPELCGKFEYSNDTVIWHLFDNYIINIFANAREGYIEIHSKNNFTDIHWHPECEDLYNEISKLGNHGNITVLSSTLSSSSILYSGCEEDCPYLPIKKRYKLRNLYYLKAK